MPTDLPAITYPPGLPVSARREDLARAINSHQVVIVAGETGSGKTTQLPKICLDLGRRSIGHTQPRRLAARTVAERIADELGQQVGGLVGYQVRFTDRVGAATRIKLMTDGILLGEIRRDRMLTAYDTIIIDEAHERTLNIDFLLGYLKGLLPQRPELRLIITSATIDPESFAAHFADASGRPAPIVEVSGRTYPVEVRYRPLVRAGADADTADSSTVDSSTVDSDDRDYLTGINDALDELAREAPGDVLVFLSGENEIRDAEDAIRARGLPGTEVLPLYGRLSAAEQHRVFERSATPGIRRRIVLATNVAETSLTVPGIKYVIDAGTARISRYSARAKVQRLPIEPISQASAAQRAGRAGRTSEGIAIRLYAEADFERRAEYTDPEILRTSLAAVILQLIALGLGDIESFPFLTPPASRDVKAGLDLLRELNAVTGSGTLNPRTGSEPRNELRLTKIGKDLARLPLDPRFARMVIESRRHGVTREVFAIVAGLTVQDPRERPLEKRAQADQAHARHTDPTSDFLTILNLWNHLEERQRELSSSAFRRLCRSEYINYLRVREWQDLYKQLTRLAKGLRLTVGEARVDADGIHRSLLAGLLSHLGIRDPQKKDYVGARQSRFVIFPGSALVKKQPRAVMSGELVETSRLFARMNAAIDPAWAEPIAGELCKRSHGEPHWEERQGTAVAYEKVTLFGVPIIDRRRVHYARIDPEHARELFIRHGLVDAEPRRDNRLWDFLRENRELAERLGEVEERTRRRDILAGDEALYGFYDRRLPDTVASRQSFESWWRDERQRSPRLLTMTESELLDDESSIDESEYPSNWGQGDQRLELAYRFEPGAADDGVSVRVPLPLLPRLEPAGFDWQVPGMRAELVTALIKSLPKAIRRHVVPAADWAARLLDALPQPDASAPEAMPAALAAAIRRATGIPVKPADFDLDRVPAHLKPTFRVIDEGGRELDAGKSLAELQQRLGKRASASVAQAVTREQRSLERDALDSWDVGELPRHVDTSTAAGTVRAYPAIVDEAGTVALRLLPTEAERDRVMPGGLRRLLLAGVPSPATYIREHLTTAEKLSLAASPYPSTRALFDDCLAACADTTLREVAPDGLIFDRETFERARDILSSTIVDALTETVALVASILQAGREADKAIGQATSMALLPALTDAREQLADLVYPGFVAATGTRRLRRLPVYLRGVTHRIQKLPENPGRDRVWMTQAQSATEDYLAAGGTLPPTPGAPPDLVRVRWLLEEFRLSLFAQHLGTSEPVSAQRIRKALPAP